MSPAPRRAACALLLALAAAGCVQGEVAPFSVSGFLPAELSGDYGGDLVVLGSGFEPRVLVDARTGEVTTLPGDFQIVVQEQAFVAALLPDGRLAARLPPLVGDGSLAASLRSPSGDQAALPSMLAFRRAGPPIIDQISPATGPPVGGASVIVSGRGLSGGLEVRIGTEPLAGAMPVIDKNNAVVGIEGQLPPGQPGSLVDVQVFRPPATDPIAVMPAAFRYGVR